MDRHQGIGVVILQPGIELFHQVDVVPVALERLDHLARDFLVDRKLGQAVGTHRTGIDFGGGVLRRAAVPGDDADPHLVNIGVTDATEENFNLNIVCG